MEGIYWRSVQCPYKSSKPGGQINGCGITTANTADLGCRSNQTSSKGEGDWVWRTASRTTKNTLIRALTKLCNMTVDTGDWPNDWKKAVFVTILKVSGTTNCEDHRAVALISHKSKILLRILLNRMRNVTEEQIADVQIGFRKDVDTRDQIFNLRLLIEKQKRRQRHYISHLYITR